MYISSNIKHLINQDNSSQAKFALLFKISRPAVGAYCEGRSVPPVSLLIKISRYYGIALIDLIEKDLSKKEVKVIETNADKLFTRYQSKPVHVRKTIDELLNL